MCLSGFIKPVTDKICALAENLTLNCKVNKPISEVTWKKNGRALIQDERTKTFVNGYWHTLLIENVKKNDAATYECVFGNAVTQCDVKVQGISKVKHFSFNSLFKSNFV